MPPKGFESTQKPKEALSENSEWRSSDHSQLIKACITHESLEKNPNFSRFNHFPKKGRENILWRAGTDGIAISQIDSAPKFSNNFFSCLGFVLVGKNAAGQNISMLVHLLAYDYLSADLGREAARLRENIHGFLNEVERGSVDAVLFAGDYYDDGKPQEGIYAETITSIGRLIEQELGFDPLVISGPVINKERTVEGYTNHYTNVAFDTASRRLWVIRSNTQDDSANKPFRASQVHQALKGFPNYAG